MTGEGTAPPAEEGDEHHGVVDDLDDFDDLDDLDDLDDFAPDQGEPHARPLSSTTRVVAGIAFVILGIIAAVLAFQAATDDTSSTPNAETPRTTEAGGSTEGTGTSGSKPAASWPASVQGRPAALGTGGPPPADAGGLAPGWYLWSDFSDWHLWLVGGEGTDATAVVTTNHKLTLKNTYGEAAVESTDSSAVVRRGDGDAPIAGIDFNPGFYGNELTITVTGDLPLRTGYNSADAASPLVLRYEPQS